MRKLSLLLLFALCMLRAASQSCDRFIEWDLDDLTVKKDLPYNQTICLRLKSKKTDLSKITDVFILEHKGAKGINKSFDYYKGDSAKLEKKFSMIKIGVYDKENKTLDVQLREKKALSQNGGIEDDAEDIILQPSKQYSIFLLTGDPQPSTSKLLDSIRVYIDKVKAGDNSAAAMKVKIKSSYNKIGWAKGPLQTEYFYDTIPDKLIDFYENKIYKYDLAIDNIKNDTASFLRNLTIDEKLLPDSITLFIEKNLGIIITKAGCAFQYPCEVDKCTLYKMLIALKERKEGTIKKVVAGSTKVTDFINPLFKPSKTLKLTERISNMDSSLLYLNNLKLYLNYVFINDCKAYSCCDTAKKINWQAIETGIKNYLITIDSIIEKLKDLKNLYMLLEDTRTEKANTIRKEFLDYLVQFKTGNTLTYGLEPRNKLVILPVFGYAYYGFQKSFNSFTPYTGIVISLAPINDSIEYRFLKKKTWAQRLSFFVGVTLSSLKEDNKRDNLFSNGANLMTGFGYKLNHVVTVNTGGIIFRKVDPNPFTPTKKITVTPFVSLSLNLKLETLFKGLIGLIPGK